MMARSELGYSAREFWDESPRLLTTLIRKWNETRRAEKGADEIEPEEAPMAAWAL